MQKVLKTLKGTNGIIFRREKKRGLLPKYKALKASSAIIIFLIHYLSLLTLRTLKIRFILFLFWREDALVLITNNTFAPKKSISITVRIWYQCISTDCSGTNLMPICMQWLQLPKIWCIIQGDILFVRNSLRSQDQR